MHQRPHGGQAAVHGNHLTGQASRAVAAGALQLDPQPQAPQRAQRRRALQDKPWVVYAKTPLAGPAAVLDYLSRYTNRTAIGNERLKDIRGDKVLFTTRVNGHARRGKQAHADGRSGPASTSPGRRVSALPGVEVLERLLMHTLPQGCKRIRHYGLLAPSVKSKRLASARALLGMPAANPAADEAVAEFMRRVAAIDIERCPRCADHHKRWRVVAACVPLHLAGRSRLPAATPAAAATADPVCRGPPP